MSVTEQQSSPMGILFAAYLWSLTVQGTGLWTYHTCFRVAGIIFVLAILLQLRLRLSGESVTGSSTA